jgi:hypothetical protein
MEVRFTNIPPATVERIAKLLTRLGDDNQHEVLAACGAIVATLNGAGHDLHDLANNQAPSHRTAIAPQSVQGSHQLHSRGR